MNMQQAARSGMLPTEWRARNRAAFNTEAGKPSPADGMLDAFFTGEISSFRECYIDITGDRRVTGLQEHGDPTRMMTMTNFAEAVTTSTFGNILGAAMHRSLVREYATLIERSSVWHKIVQTVPLTDFRTQNRARLGGYGVPLPTVNEGAPYTALTSPPDENIQYVPTKLGGTETVTLEAIRNNDVGLIREIPQKLAIAAERTLADFVLDMLRTNPTIYDGVALFHASHGNLGATALSAVSVSAAFVAMQKQAEAGSGRRLNLQGKFLLVPPDLEELGFNLFQRNTNNDKFYIQTQGIEVLPVINWTDTNDWVLACDPRDLPCIEIGFMDGNQEPDIFLQDLPTAGSFFSNDQITFKIRHIYGGAVKDYRGLYKAVVA